MLTVRCMRAVVLDARMTIFINISKRLPLHSGSLTPACVCRSHVRPHNNDEGSPGPQGQHAQTCLHCPDPDPTAFLHAWKAERNSCWTQDFQWYSLSAAQQVTFCLAVQLHSLPGQQRPPKLLSLLLQGGSWPLLHPPGRLHADPVWS